MPDLSNPIL